MDHAETEGGAPNILNLNIHKYEQRQCDQLAGMSGTGIRVGGSPLTSLRTTGSLYVPERGQKKKKTWVWIDTGQALRGQRSWTDLGFLLLCEVIFDVEGLPDLLGGLSFDHVGHRLTGDVQQAFNVQVIGRLKDKSKGRGPETAARALQIFPRYFGGNSAHMS